VVGSGRHGWGVRSASSFYEAESMESRCVRNSKFEVCKDLEFTSLHSFIDDTRGRELVEMRSRPCAPHSGLNEQNGTDV
jgi:hypothetical protein